MLIRALGVFATIVALTPAEMSCSELREENVDFTFSNRTSTSSFCVFVSYDEPNTGICPDSDALNAESEGSLRWECGDGPGVEELPFTVAITAQETGVVIYERTAKCRVWQDSSREFTIDEVDDDFVVLDPLS